MNQNEKALEALRKIAACDLSGDARADRMTMRCIARDTIAALSQPETGEEKLKEMVLHLSMRLSALGHDASEGFDLVHGYTDSQALEKGE